MCRQTPVICAMHMVSSSDVDLSWCKVQNVVSIGPSEMDFGKLTYKCTVFADVMQMLQRNHNHISVPCNLHFHGTCSS